LWSFAGWFLVMFARPAMSQGGPARTHRDTLIDMETEVRWLYGVVRLYHHEHRVWPSTLNDACGGYPSERCPGLGVLDSIPLDSWGVPVYYTHQPDGFEIRSLGSDRRPGTSDDMVISYPQDIVQSARIAGCYRPTAGWWARGPVEVRLDTLDGTLFDFRAGYGVTAEFPRHKRYAQWYPTSRDSISLQWNDGVEIRMLRMAIFGDTLRGRVTYDDLDWNGIVTMVKTRCAS